MKPILTFRLDYQALATEAEATAYRSLLKMEQETRPAWKKALRKIHKGHRNIAAYYRFEADKAHAAKIAAERLTA